LDLVVMAADDHVNVLLKGGASINPIATRLDLLPESETNAQRLPASKAYLGITQDFFRCKSPSPIVRPVRYRASSCYLRCWPECPQRAKTHVVRAGSSRIVR